ncbi:hypothetical protein CHS0354_037386 [Potamilus streckersoni]|uniref:Uncharacterized protein n=1 Tax=Potamilus streckersoni TaxID=2493646 RepID=A0AAE0RR30_9BIVA|nr:hypothetical protein CHS0354_037386 [Potamilus streckersoni]
MLLCLCFKRKPEELKIKPKLPSDNVGTPKNLTLYIHALSAPSRAVWMTAKAADIPVQIRHIDLFKGEHKTPEFAKINPDTTIPTMVDGNYSLWESRPIMTYMVQRYGKNPKLYPKDLQDRALVDRLLHYDLGSVYKSVSEYMYPQLFQGKPPDIEKENGMKKTFDYLNRQLDGQRHMAGDEMTLADISMATNIALLELRNYNLDQWPLLSAWYQRMKLLPYWNECNKGLYDWKSPIMKDSLE